MSYPRPPLSDSKSSPDGYEQEKILVLCEGRKKMSALKKPVNKPNIHSYAGNRRMGSLILNYF